MPPLLTDRQTDVWIDRWMEGWTNALQMLQVSKAKTLKLQSRIKISLVLSALNPWLYVSHPLSSAQFQGCIARDVTAIYN